MSNKQIAKFKKSRRRIPQQQFEVQPDGKKLGVSHREFGNRKLERN